MSPHTEVFPVVNLPNLVNLVNLLKNKLATDRPGTGVIRHRVRSRLHGRRLQLAAAAVAIALVGGAAAANAAGPDEPASQTAGGSAADLADRAAAADRADRSQRTGGGKDDKHDKNEKKDAGTKGKSSKPKQDKQPDKPKKKQEKPKKKKKDWVHPMPGARTTSCYGARWGTLHAGVDLAAPAGAPIRAVGAGRVIGAGWLYGGYGISVVIDHGNGFLTHYAHASRVKVSAGQRVKPGQKIALEGSTGNSTGPHLHLEVHRGLWNQIEPTRWLANQGVKIAGC